MTLSFVLWCLSPALRYHAWRSPKLQGMMGEAFEEFCKDYFSGPYLSE